MVSLHYLALLPQIMGTCSSIVGRGGIGNGGESLSLHSKFNTMLAKVRCLMADWSFYLFLIFFVNELKFWHACWWIKMSSITFGIQWNCFDQLPLLQKMFAFIWQLLHAHIMRTCKVIVCLLAPMCWRKQCMWEVWDLSHIMYCNVMQPTLVIL